MKYAMMVAIWLLIGLASDLAYIGEANRQCGYYPRSRGIFAMFCGGPLLLWLPISEARLDCQAMHPIS